MKLAYTLLGFLALLACSKPHVSQSPQPLPAPSKAEYEQFWAAEAKSQQWLETISTYRELFLADAAETVSLIQAGRPLTLERPSVGPVVAETITTSYWVPHTDGFMTTWDHSKYVPYRPIDEKFGLPIQEIEDSLPPEVMLKMDAKGAILTWYAARGIYPANSTKRKKP